MPLFFIIWHLHYLVPIFTDDGLKYITEEHGNGVVGDTGVFQVLVAVASHKEAQHHYPALDLAAVPLASW